MPSTFSRKDASFGIIQDALFAEVSRRHVAFLNGARCTVVVTHLPLF